MSILYIIKNGISIYNDLKEEMQFVLKEEHIFSFDKPPQSEYNTLVSKPNDRACSAERPYVRKVRAPQGMDNG